MSTSSRRSGSQPSTPRSRALSVKHLKDSVKFNKEHAKDHESHEKHGYYQAAESGKSRAGF